MKKILILCSWICIVTLCGSCDTLNRNNDIGFIDKKELAWLQNDSIRFSILPVDRRDSIEKCFVFIVCVDFKSYENVKIAERIPPLQWIELLNDENTDWAANLCLYNMRFRDAFFYLGDGIRTRKAWLKTNKYREDLDYWSKIMWEEVKK